MVAVLGQVHLARLLVDAEVAGAVFLGLRLQFLHQRVHPPVQVGAVRRRPGDDQRRARFVDQDRVHLVDDREIEGAHRLVLGAQRHVVAQIVETELVVGAVSDVGGVGGAALLAAEALHDDADRQAQALVDRPHPLGVAPRQVVVGDHVHALAGQRVQAGRQGRHQGLALASAHLRDAALVQHQPADQLHVEVAQAEAAPRRLAHQREHFRQPRVPRRGPGGGLAAGRRQFGAELSGARAQCVVGAGPQPFLQPVDVGHGAPVALDRALVAAAEQAAGGGGEHGRAGRGVRTSDYTRRRLSGGRT